MDADLGTDTDRGHWLRLGEDLGVRADADLEVLRPRALCDQRVLEPRGVGRAGAHARKIVADHRDDRPADRFRLGRITARLLLDHPFQHARHEGHAAGLDRLQIAGCEEPRAAAVAPVPCRVGQRLGDRRDPGTAVGGANGGERIVELEQSARRRRDLRNVVDAIIAQRDERGPVDQGQPCPSNELCLLTLLGQACFDAQALIHTSCPPPRERESRLAGGPTNATRPPAIFSRRRAGGNPGRTCPDRINATGERQTWLRPRARRGRNGR